ncbi:MAG: hypothetical protein JO021_00440 [Alphaproteobacteria bacterium]|nr:hypothetical protein [Alphaproteobacteria bacterium]
MTTDTTDRWHLITTEPQRERYAAGELGHEGFFTYLPLVLEPVRRGRRTILDRRPLFPGYVFTAFDVADAARWGKIQRTKGCVAPVRIAGALAALTSAQYDALRALEDPDGVIRLAQPVPVRLHAGEQVRVNAGPWSGFLGKVLATKGGERVRLLLGALEIEMASRMVDRVKAAVALAALLLGGALACVTGAAAHELTDDPAASAWLQRQVNPTDGTPCCNQHDCFLTRWRSAGGQIQALLPDGATWVDLPPTARLRENHYGELLLCWNGRVLCWAEGAGF